MFEQGEEIEDVSAEDLMEHIIPQIVEQHPEASTLDIFKKFLRGTCPRAFVDPAIGDIIEAEAFCREYHVSPLGANVGFLDHPTKLVQAFGIIATARERYKEQRMKQMQAQAAASK